MKQNSIRAKLEQKEVALGKKSATERQEINKNPPVGVKERQEFFNSAKAKKKSFFSNLKQQMQKIDQKERLAVEETLRQLKWQKMYSGPVATTFFNKQVPGAYLVIKDEEFAIFDGTEKGWPLFEGATPKIGPESTGTMEESLKALKSI